MNGTCSTRATCRQHFKVLPLAVCFCLFLSFSYFPVVLYSSENFDNKTLFFIKVKNQGEDIQKYISQYSVLNTPPLTEAWRKLLVTCYLDSAIFMHY